MSEKPGVPEVPKPTPESFRREPLSETEQLESEIAAAKKQILLKQEELAKEKSGVRESVLRNELQELHNDLARLVMKKVQGSQE